MWDVFFDGRLYQDSSRRRQGSLGAGVHLCQFTSEKGVVGGEFTLLDLETRAHFREDLRRDPHHSAELLLRGLQLRIEYMNTNLVFLRLNQAELHLNDEWRLREADQLVRIVPSAAETDTASAALSRDAAGADREEPATACTAAIGAPPVYVSVAGELNWDQLQVGGC